MGSISRNQLFESVAFTGIIGAISLHFCVNTGDPMGNFLGIQLPNSCFALINEIFQLRIQSAKPSDHDGRVEILALKLEQSFVDRKLGFGAEKLVCQC